jgi:hypothetical protein
MLFSPYFYTTFGQLKSDVLNMRIPVCQFMEREQIQKIIKGELEHIPKGLKGSPQNQLRNLYTVMREHSLGKHVVNKITKEEVLMQAIDSIIINNPEFKPDYDSNFFLIDE